MRYWKCIRSDNEGKDFKIGKIYESDDNGFNVRDESGFLWDNTFICKTGFGEFEKATRRDYLYQLEKEGKLEFNERDFVNGDLAVKFNGWCKFSGELYEICNKYKLINIWHFDGSSKYYVVGMSVEFGYQQLPTVHAYNTSKEIKSKEKKEEIKVKKFKIGDKVRIIKNLSSGHGFKIGEEVVIIEEDEDDLNLTYKGKGEKYTDSPWVNSEEIELIGNRETFELNILSKDGVTTCTYKVNGELKRNESVKLYYKDAFNIETAVQEVLKKVFSKKPHEVFEGKVEKKLGRKPTSEELIEAYRKEIK